jgi:phage tail-like protein
LPPGLTLADYLALEPVLGAGDSQRPKRRLPLSLPTTTWSEGTNYLTWSEEGELEPGDRYEYVAEAEVVPTQEDLVIESWAALTARTARGGTVRDEEAAVIGVEAKSRVLRFLPAIYREDELMGRLLMLFESFWRPIERQIDELPYYFDPELAPSELLPWLASWIDLTLDEQWPEDRRRRLLGSAIPLFRKRGTCQGLAQYLEIYTGVEPEIIEYRAQNFRLGLGGQLGSGIALGRDNIPHTFAVKLRLPAINGHRLVDQTQDAEQAAPRGDVGRAAERQEGLRRRKIEAIIDAQKPAHTRYKLLLETDADLPGMQRTAPAEPQER